ncbi:MAG TPA: hypothetical protein VM406_11975 [Noviherbaspirillum sp.]|nr:hypothetical protein [Noviherbaspirillum sp.]
MPSAPSFRRTRSLPAGLLTLAALGVAPHAPAYAQAGASSVPARLAAPVLVRYVYYPDLQVYYSTQQQIWFWMNGSGWSYGVDLPDTYRERLGTGIALKLATARPFEEHASVEQRIGRPWRRQQELRREEQGGDAQARGAADKDNG